MDPGKKQKKQYYQRLCSFRLIFETRMDWKRFLLHKSKAHCIILTLVINCSLTTCSFFLLVSHV
jgi:hypothetical protein